METVHVELTRRTHTHSRSAGALFHAPDDTCFRGAFNVLCIQLALFEAAAYYSMTNYSYAFFISVFSEPWIQARPN